MEHAGHGEDAKEISREDRLVTEEPLEIRVRVGGHEPRRAWVTMRTPGHDFELAAGWLVNEGLATPDTLDRVAYCTDTDLDPEQEFNVVTVTLRGAAELPHRHTAASAGSSACGVCGKDSVADALQVRSAAPWSGERPGADVVRRLPEALRERQEIFARTGGVHAAGLATADGEMLVVREDVGRHNAVDKVVGARVLQGQPRGRLLPGAERPGGVRAGAEGRGQRHRVHRRRGSAHEPRRAAGAGGRDRAVGLHLAPSFGELLLSLDPGLTTAGGVGARDCRCAVIRSLRAHPPHLRLAPGEVLPP